MLQFSSVLTLSVLFFVSANASAIDKVFPGNGDDDTFCKSLVQTQGYACEEHKVTTEDGYILSLLRIPVGRSGKTGNKPPVLLQHGVFTDAVPWVLNSPDESLGFILADNGFDVWLANTRGTKYSSGHTSLSSNESAYWEWSWDELVQYDLPAFVQYVHYKTGQKLHFVGYSLGTLIALASFSQQDRKLTNMFRSAVLLGPIAYLNRIQSELTKAAIQLHLAEVLYSSGHYEFPPGWDILGPFLEKICNGTGSNCFDGVSALTGSNCCLNNSRASLLLKREPQPTATKNIIHLSQMIRTGTISMYDYGSDDENRKHYGNSNPPVYNLRNIPRELPLCLGYGGQDMLADVDDINALLNDLKDHDNGELSHVYREKYAHLDFLLGVNANQVVYDHVISFFNLH